MLKLVLGRQRSGKTHECLLIAENAVKQGKKVIMLVPEQYSFECQRHLLETLGSKISNSIEIHSFTSLCEAIGVVYGGISGVNVDESTRFILVGQALKNVKDSLKMYGKYTSSTSFVNQMLSIITELKQCNVSAESLKLMSEKTDSEVLSRKLNDISLILSAYDAVLTNRFVDPLDLIDRTVELMRDNLYFKDTTVIIDEFKGFTESQYLLLDRMIASSENTVVSLCCDSLYAKNDTDIFKSVKNSAGRLVEIAKSHSVLVDEPLVLSYSDNVADDIVALESFVAEANSQSFSGNVDNITIFQADNCLGEVDYVMQTIRRMVRENGMRYRDFVIISRSDNVYSSLIEESSKLYNVPCYTDISIPVTQLPLSVLVISAVNAALSNDTEDILRVAKTGLAGLDSNEISDLENYIYIWSISGKKWFEDWDMNPNGLEAIRESKEEAIKLEIQSLNSLRKRLIEPLTTLRFNLKGTAENMCGAVLKYLESCNAIDLLRKYTYFLENDGRLQEAEYQRTGYDVFIKALDKIVASLGENEITAKEFAEILNATLRFETVGEIPKLKDQVIYGTADRIRPFRPKVAFVVGVNQDVFPAALNSGGLLTSGERELLIDNGLKVSDHSINDCLDEKLLFYFACSYASNKVFISYSKSTMSGSAMEPSPEISLLCDRFENLKITKQNRDYSLESAETAEVAFRDVAKFFKYSDETLDSVKAYFAECEEYSSRIKSLVSYLNRDVPSISHESALGIYGDEVRLSASKADDFAGCKFLYFCKYGLSAGKLDKVEYNPLTRGNIVHFCLEKFINNHKNDIGQLEDNAIKDEIFDLSKQFLTDQNVSDNQLDDKFKYMIKIVNETVVSLAIALNNEFKISQFRPFACELKIGGSGDVDGIEILTDKGQPVTLNGYIDRVDTTADGKVRVVDYKTGSKGDSFKLSEVLNGQNLQMLLYLYALLQNGRDLIKASVPAGVLYYPAKRHVSKEKSPYVKMNGIILDDIETIAQMEPEIEGKIIPVRQKANKSGFYATDQLISEEAFGIVFKYIEHTLQRIGSTLMNGNIEPLPLSSGDHLKCDYCDYRSVCRYDINNGVKQSVDCKSEETLEKMKAELGELDNGI